MQCMHMYMSIIKLKYFCEMYKEIYYIMYKIYTYNV